MTERINVVGAGVIGASIAYRLAQGGAEVTLIDAATPASGASGRSFGWINASFSLNARHFGFRVAAMAAHHRLAVDLGDTATTWPGTLAWDEVGAAQDQTFTRLTEAGYPVRRLSRAEFRALEPAIATPPETALHYPTEGVTDLAGLTHRLIAGAARHGARVLLGLPVTGITTRAGRITGLATAEGQLPADRVVLAAGTGTPDLLAPLGLALPMLHRPAIILRTQSLPPLLNHILVTPAMEIRQEPDGRILAPTSPNHQADDATDLAAPPEALADEAIRHIAELLPGAAPRWQEALRAFRPVPGDGLPVMGEVAEGLYLAVMHSGATLAALAGELAAREIIGGSDEPLLAPYRPGRFG
ncbi:MAG TPA: FAD-dependent oxidoreductase [Albidovulum sp.]|uniref:NAD(P)/FAD-dependent oxidoreductase n=1 Tax=Albidovulum sp. TaxID=1872424 RepID=UPI002C94B04B|nr:FAD-dependent oxidoreductase [Albidovulum sp.]